MFRVSDNQISSLHRNSQSSRFSQYIHHETFSVRVRFLLLCFFRKVRTHTVFTRTCYESKHTAYWCKIHLTLIGHGRWRYVHVFDTTTQLTLNAEYFDWHISRKLLQFCYNKTIQFLVYEIKLGVTDSVFWKSMVASIHVKKTA